MTSRPTLLRALTIAVALSAISVWGCTDSKAISELRQQNEWQADALHDVKESIAKLEDDLMTATLQRDVFLRTSDQGFNSVQTELGTLTMRITDVRPFGNGVRVAITIGNPLNATLLNMEAAGEWGTVSDKGYPDAKVRRSGTVSLGQRIRAGSFNPIQVVLDGISPSEFGYLRLSEVRQSGIELMTPR